MLSKQLYIAETVVLGYQSKHGMLTASGQSKLDISKRPFTVHCLWLSPWIPWMAPSPGPLGMYEAIETVHVLNNPNMVMNSEGKTTSFSFRTLFVLFQQTSSCLEWGHCKGDLVMEGPFYKVLGQHFI